MNPHFGNAKLLFMRKFHTNTGQVFKVEAPTEWIFSGITRGLLFFILVDMGNLVMRLSSIYDPLRGDIRLRVFKRELGAYQNGMSSGEDCGR